MMWLLPLVVLQAPPESGPFAPDSLRATIEKLSSWNTRNTSTPELGQAADWVADQFRAIPAAQVEIIPYQVIKGPRVPIDRQIVEVIARFPATTAAPEPGTIVMGGHLDSINMTPGADVFTARAPGANDDGSGVAATLATARWMATQSHSHPLMFVAFSGEEQGLLGSEALAERAAKEGWNLDALLSNDMIGNSQNLAGQKDSKHVRLFSEEGTTTQSRELARFIEWLARTSGPKGHGVKLVFRSDRFGRGGDHSSFNKNGFTAVRFVDVNEEYSRQHTPNDLPEFVDYDYLSKNARLNATVVDSLANAAPQPTRVRQDRRQNHDSTLTWVATPGVKYVVYWRATTSPTWEHFKAVGEVNTSAFKLVSKDDNVFAVGAEGGIPVEAR